MLHTEKIDLVDIKTAPPHSRNKSKKPLRNWRDKMLTKDKLAETLLNELKEECLVILSLLNQLDTPGISDTQEDEILGELSARLVHL